MLLVYLVVLPFFPIFSMQEEKPDQVKLSDALRLVGELNVAISGDNHLLVASMLAPTGSINKAGIDINNSEQIGEHRLPLHVAIDYNRLAMVEFLVEKGGAQVVARDKVGHTALHRVACNNYIQVAETLLKYAPLGAVNIRGNDMTPLHVAAFANQLAMAQLFLKHQADVHAEDFAGNTPLHIAEFRRYKDIAQALIQCGANTDKKNKAGYRPDEMAILAKCDEENRDGNEEKSNDVKLVFVIRRIVRN